MHEFASGFAKAWRVTSRWLPQGWLDALRQLALFAGAYYAYRLVRGLVDGQAVLAFENARNLVDAERAMGLFFEPGLQAWAQGEDWIVTGANWMYVNSHFVVTTTFLIWLYIARNHAYYYVRNMFMIAHGPRPRRLPGLPDRAAALHARVGLHRHRRGIRGDPPSRAPTCSTTRSRPCPSMHVAFALMIGIPAIKLVKHRAVKVAWALYPVLVTFVVVVTANHFWLDAALGALVAAISAAGASYALGRARPAAWAWRTARREAVA